jgi:hypothetical protein
VEVSGREICFGVGQKLAEECDGEVLQQAAKAVAFDSEGLGDRVRA